MAHPAHVGEWVGEDGQGGSEEQREASGARQRGVDGQRRRAFQEALIDAEKPERRKAERIAAAGLEQHGNRAGEDWKQEQEHQQSGDGEALQEERKFAEQAFAENGEKHALQSQDEGRGKQAAARHGQQMTGEKAGKVGRIDGRGKNQRGEDIGVEQKAGDEESRWPRRAREKPAIREWAKS